ncbi:MAG: BamA/TamA family outer membrane protein [Chitinophagales bacterium]|nr:BamA/TamA family outer membrane protein [Chitinophagales bacterium]
MKYKISVHILCISVIAILVNTGCNSTKYLKEDEYLLRSNSVKLKSDKYVDHKGELTDNLSGVVAQKPNSYFLLPGFTYKLWLYNLRHDKYQQDTLNFQIESGTVEKPVIYDSSSTSRSQQYMESYLFQQGYFYAEVSDTTKFKKQKAYVEYQVNTGINYLIDKVDMTEIDDSTIAKFVRRRFYETNLRTGKAYSASLVEKERSRIVNMIRGEGYYYFSNENVAFVLDTMNKGYMKEKESAVETVAGFVSRKEDERRTLDIAIKITDNGNPKSFKRYGINNITIYPDFKDKGDLTDDNMMEKTVPGADKVVFRYHDYYIKEKVIYNHLFLSPETYFALEAHDKTITELNQLGVFSGVRIIFTEDSTRTGETGWMNCLVLMSPADKWNWGTNWEVSNGTTYTLGTGLTASVRNTNVAKGANLFTLSANGGLESQFDTSSGAFKIITNTLGLNASIELPKFLFPISRKRYSISNTPRTELAGGATRLERLNYFTLFNLSTRFTYKWLETKEKSWEVTPAFINNISLPPSKISAEFQQRLDTNDFLKNSYRETFIEGENISWTFDNSQDAKWYDDFSYIKLSFEEAGGVVAGVNSITKNLDNKFSQYVKFDFDLRHFIRQRHTTTALRFYGGVGIPYNKTQSPTLPYLKQYFVGGAYSMRGWRIRSLGPGGYVDTNSNPNLIDRTGDMKLELNGEYRFDIFKAFGGALLFNGAVFADAGNIWLFYPSADYDDGHFQFNKLYNHMAVNSGFGIRVDVAEIFLLRVDCGIPLKQPGTKEYPDKGIYSGWIVDRIAPFDGKWRGQNMIWSIAIGYPF